MASGSPKVFIGYSHDSPEFGTSEVVRESIAKLYGVPELPPHYLSREEDLAGLKKKLLGGDGNPGIREQSSVVGIQGMGGIGKTVLATALVHDAEVRNK